MSAMAWIAIAAIIAASINSWSQFLLKERSEKKKALAVANPATNQPSPVKSAGLTVVQTLKLRPLMYLSQWLVITLVGQLAMGFYEGTIQASLTTILALTYTVLLAVVINILVWRKNKFQISD